MGGQLYFIVQNKYKVYSLFRQVHCVSEGCYYYFTTVRVIDLMNIRKVDCAAAALELGLMKSLQLFGSENPSTVTESCALTQIYDRKNVQ